MITFEQMQASPLPVTLYVVQAYFFGDGAKQYEIRDFRVTRIVGPRKRLALNAESRWIRFLASGEVCWSVAPDLGETCQIDGIGAYRTIGEAEAAIEPLRQAERARVVTRLQVQLREAEGLAARWAKNADTLRARLAELGVVP